MVFFNLNETDGHTEERTHRPKNTMPLSAALQQVHGLLTLTSLFEVS